MRPAFFHRDPEAAAERSRIAERTDLTDGAKRKLLQNLKKAVKKKEKREAAGAGRGGTTG